jgi:hypothetical protein
MLSDDYGKTIFEITDVFMKVSGDMDALRHILKRQNDMEAKEGKDADGADGDGADKEKELEPLPCEWNYIEDIALSMPENSAEYRDLLTKKGKEEIEKRKVFLLGAQGNIQFTKQNTTSSGLITHP